MTMKYLYVLKSIFEEYKGEEGKIFPNLTEKLEENLHIPVDSCIMEAVTREFGVKLPGKDKELSGYSSAKAWSTWERPHYETFREQINREEIKKKIGRPLDWEGPAWIEIAKKRKKK